MRPQSHLETWHDSSLLFVYELYHANLWEYQRRNIPICRLQNHSQVSAYNTRRNIQLVGANWHLLQGTPIIAIHVNAYQSPSLSFSPLFDMHYDRKSVSWAHVRWLCCGALSGRAVSSVSCRQIDILIRFYCRRSGMNVQDNFWRAGTPLLCGTGMRREPRKPRLKRGNQKFGKCSAVFRSICNLLY